MMSLREATKRIFFTGCLASSLLLTLRTSEITSMLYVCCCIPLYVSVLSMPGYAYLKIISDYPKLNQLIFNIFIFCMLNLSLFTTLFIIFSSLRIDESISASWFSIFISIYYTLFIFFILLACIHFMTSSPSFDTELKFLLIWGLGALSTTILLSFYLDNKLDSIWIVLSPICFAELMSITFYLLEKEWKDSSNYWQTVVFVFVPAQVAVIGIEKWVWVYAGTTVFWAIQWTLNEIAVGNGYLQL